MTGKVTKLDILANNRFFTSVCQYECQDVPKQIQTKIELGETSFFWWGGSKVAITEIYFFFFYIFQTIQGRLSTVILSWSLNTMEVFLM